MNDKKYLVDGEPMSAIELLNLASDLNSNFRRCVIQRTSIAVTVLRAYGYTVDYNPNYQLASSRRSFN
jgi:hypothetical protein